MILFHGSNMEIKHIDLEMGRPYKDFGRGFYLTEIEEQAEKMAQRVARIYEGKSCVTSFEFDEHAFKEGALSIRTFDKPSTEWALFVINNRNREFWDFMSRECNHDCKFDIVKGPIANDDLALLFRQFSGGLIDVETLTREMKYKKLTGQYSFHSEKAISYLTKMGACYE